MQIEFKPHLEEVHQSGWAETMLLWAEQYVTMEEFCTATWHRLQGETMDLQSVSKIGSEKQIRCAWSLDKV